MCWLGSGEGDSDSPLVSSVIFFGDTGLGGGGSGLVQCLYGEGVRHISFVGIALERKMTSSNFRFFVQIANVTYVYQNLFREAQKNRVHKLSIAHLSVSETAILAFGIPVTISLACAETSTVLLPGELLSSEQASTVFATSAANLLEWRVSYLTTWNTTTGTLPLPNSQSSTVFFLSA